MSIHHSQQKSPKKAKKTVHIRTAFFLYNMTFLFLQSREALFKICNDVVNMLCSDGKTDGILVNSLVVKFSLCKLRMGSSCRMDHKTLYICYIGK